MSRPPGIPVMLKEYITARTGEHSVKKRSFPTDICRRCFLHESTLEKLGRKLVKVNCCEFKVCTDCARDNECVHCDKTSNNKYICKCHLFYIANTQCMPLEISEFEKSHLTCEESFVCIKHLKLHLSTLEDMVKDEKCFLDKQQKSYENDLMIKIKKPRVLGQDY